MPPEERKDVIRVMFQIELAHWFYLDLEARPGSQLPRLSLTAFTRTMFQHISRTNDFKYLKKKIPEVDDVVAKFKEYKAMVPTYGVIILDESMTQCLMVQGYGGNGWGFPKGKINDSEDPIHCAIRELKEETGFDCEHLINQKDVIRKNFKGTDMVLYIISGVNLNQSFRAESRNEIKQIKWFDIDSLPDNFGSKTSSTYYMAIPFISELREWIIKRQSTDVRQRLPDACPVSNSLPLTSDHSVVRILTKKRTKQDHRRRFWTKLWDNVSLDWDAIWDEVDVELSCSQGV